MHWQSACQLSKEWTAAAKTKAMQRFHELLPYITEKAGIPVDQVWPAQVYATKQTCYCFLSLEHLGPILGTVELRQASINKPGKACHHHIKKSFE